RESETTFDQPFLRTGLRLRWRFGFAMAVGFGLRSWIWLTLIDRSRFPPLGWKWRVIARRGRNVADWRVVRRDRGRPMRDQPSHDPANTQQQQQQGNHARLAHGDSAGEQGTPDYRKKAAAPNRGRRTIPAETANRTACCANRQRLSGMRSSMPTFASRRT